MKRLFFLTGILWFAVTGSAQISSTGSPAKKPFVLGLIDEIHSKILAENRVLNIYLPAGYIARDSVLYPVVYLLDGSADEDFIHVAGLYQFNNFEWIDRVPKSIVVGIATIDRRRDFTSPSDVAEEKKRYPESGHSDKFISFIEKELQPYIRQEYNSTADATIIGQSLGGLLATEILFTKPGLFNKYIIISPSLWWNSAGLLQSPRQTTSGDIRGETSVYIGVGKEGLTPGTPRRVMEVDANLLADKIRSQNKQVKVYFDYLPEEDHATVAHRAIFNALRLLYPAKK